MVSLLWNGDEVQKIKINFILYYIKMWLTTKSINGEQSMRKKWIEWIFVVLWLIILFIILWGFTTRLITNFIDTSFISDTLLWMTLSFSFLIVLSLSLLIVYLIIFIRTRKSWWNDKLKKRLKISLFIILPFLFLSAFAFFTKAWTISNRFNIELLEAEEEYDRWVIGWCDARGHCYDKPIIYLYPTSESEIHVNLWAPENLYHTYPKYNSKKWWNVIAQPNGDLEDIETWRKLYALYREWKSDNETNFDEWFVVAWKDIIPFLEDKLAILWLNEREAEEFIVYWLPQMENNEWNLIRFESIEEQNENMPLNIIPTPDTVIRVMMDWKAINEPINIPEQQLTTPERNGFTVVEWWWSPRN